MMCDQFYAIMCNNVGFLVVLMKIIIIMTGNNEGGERNEQTALTNSKVILSVCASTRGFTRVTRVLLAQILTVLAGQEVLCGHLCSLQFVGVIHTATTVQGHQV